MLIRVLEMPVGTRVFVTSGSGSYGYDFYYGTVTGEMESRIVVKWDVGEPVPVGIMPDGYSMDYGPMGRRTYEFVSFEESDSLTPVLPFRGI